MKYKLQPNTGHGILIDRTPIIQEDRGTFTVSFLLPEATQGTFVAVFSGSDGKEHVRAITDGKVIIPREVLNGDLYIDVRVSQLDGDRIINTWTCEPLHIVPFLERAKTQWELSGGMTDKGAIERIAALEQLVDRLAGEVEAIKNPPHGDIL